MHDDGMLSAEPQVSVAEEYGKKLRTYPDLMSPAAYGDSTKEWTHLVLTKVC